MRRLPIAVSPSPPRRAPRVLLAPGSRRGRALRHPRASRGRHRRSRPTATWYWGYGVAVGRKGAANFVCAGDTVFEAGEPVLGYGERQIKNRFRCSSKQKGMRCVNTKNKHGFFLSRDTVRVF